jgi:hypothetical protein
MVTLNVNSIKSSTIELLKKCSNKEIKTIGYLGTV